MNKKANQSGQALIEFLAGGPVLVGFFAALAFTLALGWIQLEVSALTQEFGVCLQARNQDAWCRQTFEGSLRKLPGHFRVQNFQLSRRNLRVEFKHRLPFLKPIWSFDEPIQVYPQQ